MTGQYKITIANRYLKYIFTIKRNITVVRGDSATGKTTLIEMIREYNEQEDSGIRLSSEKPCVVLYGKDWKEKLERISDSIVFIDEVSRFTNSEEFARAIHGSDNYYVIISREGLKNLSFSVKEIYGIRENGKYNHLEYPYTVNEFYQIYGEKTAEPFHPEQVITEDSNSGSEFWSFVCETANISCEAAGGKSKILNMIRKNSADLGIKLAIVDGAAYGCELDETMKYIRYRDHNVKLYAPESFEYLILSSGLFEFKELKKCLEETWMYADSRIYISWEQYYTHLLAEKTQGTQMRYQKSRLNSYYLSDKVCKAVLKNVPEIILWKKIAE